LAKVVLVTGGSRGIGAAVCRKFAMEGYAVAVNYQTSREKAEAVAAECGGTAVQADVADRAAVDAMFDIVEATLGQVSVLVNNAGIQQIGLFQDCSPEDWERIFAVNVRGVYHCCERALPTMLREQSGAIVNVSSVWGLCGGSCESHYSAAKAAVIGYTKALAKEWGPSGIRVNCVAPGAVETDMNAWLSEADRLSLFEETPLGRMGRPEEIAEAVFFLGSPKSAFITGEILNVTGGLYI